MRTLAKYILGLTLAGLLVWGLMQLIPSEEKRIQSRLQHLAEIGNFTGPIGNFALWAKLDALDRCFTVDAEFALDQTGLDLPAMHSRDDLLGLAKIALTSDRGGSVQFDDIVVRVESDKQTATADLTAKITAPAIRDFGPQELRFTLKKIEAVWMITRVESLKTFGQ